MSSIQDFSVAIGIESGNASNVEKVLKNLEKIKSLDKSIKGSKLAQDLADFDLTKLSKDAGFDDLREQLSSANDSLRSMLEKTETMDAVFRSGGVMTSKMDALRQEVTDALNTTKSDMQGSVNSVKNSVGKLNERMKDKLREISEAIEAIATERHEIPSIRATMDSIDSRIEAIRDVMNQNQVGTVLVIVNEIRAMLKEMDGKMTAKPLDDLKKMISDMHVTLTSVKHLVTQRELKSLPKEKPEPGPSPPPAPASPRPPPPGYPQVPPPAPPAAPAAGMVQISAGGIPRPSAPMVYFDKVTKEPFMKVANVKKNVTLEDASRMYQKYQEFGGGHDLDKLKAWMDEKMDTQKKDIIAEVKKEREKEPVGDSVLGEGDIR